MEYIFEAKIMPVEDEWYCEVEQIDGAFAGGFTIQQACLDCTEALKLSLADYISEGEAIPKPSYSENPQLIISVDINESYIKRSKCVTPSEAAEYLGVSRGRISQLIKKNLLDYYVIDGKAMPTIKSLTERKKNPPVPHRLARKSIK